MTRRLFSSRSVRHWCGLAAAAAAVACFSACAGQQRVTVVQPVPVVVEGPSLAVAAVYEGRGFEGSMDRTGMVGVGTLELRSREEAALVCTARFETPPTEKARIRAVMTCSDGRAFALSLRNLGPDQGVGIAKEADKDALLVLFYHPSAEEAERRLVTARQDMERARQ